VRGDLAIAASYLGTSRARLRSELRSGRTLAQIAFATTGKSVAGLVGAIVAERTARIEAALAEHRLDSAKERARLKSLPRRVAVEVERSRPQAAHPGGLLSAAAHYLDLTPDQLLSALRSGRTLAQLASKRPGKSTAGLIAVLVASERARIKAALAAGKLTREKADAALAKLEQHVSARVNRPLKEHRARRAARASEGATEGA